MDRVLLGTATRPHGIKGAVQLQLFNHSDSVLKKGEVVFDEKGNSYKIKSISFGNKVIAFFEEICDRNKAEELTPFELHMERSRFPQVAEDEVYLSDLIGFKVYNEQGEAIGELVSFYDHGAAEVAVVKLDLGGELDLPFIKDFFPTIDFDEETITMISPEFL